MKVNNDKTVPKTYGPYSQAVVGNGFVFCSGQIGIEPITGSLALDAAGQTNQACKNISAVLEKHGSSLDKVVKTTVYLKSVDLYPDVNEVYASYFGETRPARSTITVANLPLGALVEIEVIALILNKRKSV